MTPHVEAQRLLRTDGARIDDIDWMAFVERVDLFEDIGELQLPFLDSDVAEVWCGHDVGKSDEWVVALRDRLALEDVHRCHTGAPAAQRRDKCAGFDESGPAGVHKQGVISHPSE